MAMEGNIGGDFHSTSKILWEKKGKEGGGEFFEMYFIDRRG